MKPTRSQFAPLSRSGALKSALFLASAAVLGWVALGPQASPTSKEGSNLSVLISPHGDLHWESPAIQAGSTVELEAELARTDLEESDAVTLVASADGQRDVSKTLHAGDPSLLVPIRTGQAGPLRLHATSSSGREMPLQTSLRKLPISADESIAFEAEPNNSWREANPFQIGRTVYGNGDDTDYLDNEDEKPVKGYANGLDNAIKDRPGLDWFRIDYKDEEPKLVIFELDILDRDVSVCLRMYTPNKEGTGIDLFLEGTDPMEIIHDREPERYSKSITRTLRKGTYYLQVIGNHPRYILRSKTYPIPPYTNAEDAVRVGAHYIMNVGDAWVAQVPREGNIYRRIQNMHDSTTKCTACHPSIFSTEAVLTAKKNGYPIEAKSNFRYVVDRIYNGPVKLYGPFDVFWQRYIAIPMQSQGKHGGILMDFEKYVSQRETPTFLRFAPFLRHAWTGMTELHPDEENGVVPKDSNVGFAIRDWIVLREAFRRTGDRSYLDTADSVRSLVTSPNVNQKNIQDKIHRIWGLAIMGRHNPAEFQEVLHAAIEEMMSFQNPDGGWPDVVEPGRGSAVYTTGQVIWTLVQAGESLETRPTFQKGIDYILSQQQPFGGWFQTTTHENFRTPMRETRYAVMALAATHPIAKEPKLGWENRDGTEGHVPRTDTLLHTLDDLDNLWQVPAGREEEFTQAILPLLASSEPLVRSVAAETLGRIGTDSAIQPLIALLDDPVKDVWRAAAWSLRQFGNHGSGVEAIKAALESKESGTRRGAARVFAYQYFGMDERLDLAEDLMKLSKDENFWTRLEALKSLRQWFYRSNENAFKRRIVDLYIDHMAQPEHSAIRTNLAQGMYIMLDENQAGGVSLERNIARFPYERDRETVLAARNHVEQSVLLDPVLEALTSGNKLQREALVASFDGSFFAGRFYAKNPTGMIDVGNDREFSFYYEPKESVLERTFEALLQADLSTQRMAQVIQLANFFFLPRDSGDSLIHQLVLKQLSSDTPEIRQAALKVVREDLALKDGEKSEETIGLVMQLLSDEKMETREAVLSAVKRNSQLLHEPRVVAYVNNLLEVGADDPALRLLLLVIVDTDLVSDAKATRILENAFTETADVDLHSTLVERLFARQAMVETESPSRDLIRLLDTIAGDPVTSIREELIEHLEKSTVLRKSPRIAEVLHSGLSDASAGIRLRSLQLAQDQPELWDDPATFEYVLRLVIDPDPKIRALALAAVDQFGLLRKEARFAPRVKSLVGDPALGEKARNLLVAGGFDPNAIEADGAVQSFGIPDLDVFKEKVNPYFYEEAADKHSCAECHQNHSILRIAGFPTGATQMSEDLVIQNMNSAFKVVNLGDPEQSLLLRKPRSPQGQGAVPADSPTGLVHVGGPRWASTAHPAYQAILTWIREAASGNKRRLGAVASADSYSPDYPPGLALDNNPQTLWHTEFVGASPGYPHEIVIDLGSVSATSAFQYVPRQDTSSGRIKGWELYVSADGKTWGDKVASGEWPNDAAVQTVPFRHQGIQYVKLKGISSADGQPFMSAAEVVVLKAKDEVVKAE
jgi:HEAT repeat protein